MGNGIKTRPVRRMTQAELDGFLEKAAFAGAQSVDNIFIAIAFLNRIKWF